MKTQRIPIALIIVNLAVLGFQFAHGSPNPPEPAVAPIIRTRALELVDDHGRVRAELKVWPAQPNVKMPDGTTGLSEAVELYVSTSQGGRNIKFGVTEDGSGLSLSGDKGYIQLLSRGVEDPFIKIVTKDGREKIFKP